MRTELQSYMLLTLTIFIVTLTITVFSCQRQVGYENQADHDSYQDWSTYLGDKQGNQYSRLKQINKSNVTQLEVAWTYTTGDSEGKEIQCNPLIIDGVLYATTGGLKCIALNASTGTLIWEFDPYKHGAKGGGNNRGLAYWQDEDERRLFHAAGSSLFALNAETGLPVSEFGIDGAIDLHVGLGDRAQDLWVIMTTPGIVYNDKYIVGGRVSEGYNAAPGFIRAFNVKTGALEWLFHTIPQPGQFGYQTWPVNAYQTVGGANSWAGMALDEERGIVYVPTGSASFDSYGGNRLGANLFANSLIALNAETGERIWHYQTIHHDIYDYDLPSPPNLLEIKRNGKIIPVVAQTTKTSNTFVFNRVTGEPIFPIKNINIPPSDVPGEKAWPTQPLPTKPPPFGRQIFTKELITNRTKAAHDTILAAYNKYRSGATMIPPSLQGTIFFPGIDGGAEWGGAATDPDKGILYVNSNEMVWTVQLIENNSYSTIFTESESPGQALYTIHCASCHGSELKGDQHYGYPALVSLESRYPQPEIRDIITGGKGMMPGFSYLKDKEVDLILQYLLRLEGEDNEADMQELALSAQEVVLPYGHQGFHRLLDPDGYPAIKPPWGNLTAIDLNEGKILWQTPLGSFDELTDQGMPRTGTENYGGPIVTAGGLIFIGASKDERMHAFDKDTGDLLWEFDLPAGGYATPSTYKVDGKQYVVIACGGDKMGTKSGDQYVAFALPD